MEVNGFVKATMKIPSLDEERNVPANRSMPLRRSWLQQEHERVQAGCSNGPARHDTHDPILGAVGLVQPTRPPPGFGDVQQQTMIDKKLWDFCKSFFEATLATVMNDFQQTGILTLKLKSESQSAAAERWSNTTILT